MERAKINSIIIPDELRENRKFLVDKIKDDARVVNFLKSNKLDETFLVDNVQMFTDWLKQLDLKDLCVDSDVCYVNDGYYLDISYNGIINKTWVPCFHEQKRLSKSVYLDKYLIKDFPDSLVDISIASILSKPESLDYTNLVIEVASFLDNPKGRGFYLAGDVGVGKTYLLSAITNELAKMNKSIAFVHTPTLANNLKAMISVRGEIERTLNVLKRVDILVLDDIGSEGVSDWIRDDVLLSILDYRMHADKTCFFTSNLTMEQLEAYYAVNNRREVNTLASKRLMERIRMTSKELTLKGSNRREYAK